MTLDYAKADVDDYTYRPKMLNARVFEELREIVGEIKDRCSTIDYAALDYDATEDMTGDERTEAREDARHGAWVAMFELLEHTDRIRTIHTKMTITFDEDYDEAQGV